MGSRRARHPSPAATQAAGRGRVGVGPRGGGTGRLSGQNPTPSCTHILLFSPRFTTLGIGHAGGNTCQLGPFGPYRRPGSAVTSPPPGLSPQGAGDGVLFIYFPCRPGGDLGCLPLRRKADGCEPGGCARARRSRTTRCTQRGPRQTPMTGWKLQSFAMFFSLGAGASVHTVALCGPCS